MSRASRMATNHPAAFRESQPSIRIRFQRTWAGRPCHAAMAKQSDEKEKFRPDMSALDREIDNALGGMSIDDLYTQSNKQAGESRAKGPRKGKVVAVDKDDVMVDFG